MRVIVAALEPALSLASCASVSLDDLQDVVANAYFEQFRRQGLSLDRIAARMKKSVRTVAKLSKSVKNQSERFAPSEELARQRALIQLLSDRSPMLLGELLAHFPPTSAKEIRAS